MPPKKKTAAKKPAATKRKPAATKKLVTPAVEPAPTPTPPKPAVKKPVDYKGSLPETCPRHPNH